MPSSSADFDRNRNAFGGEIRGGVNKSTSLAEGIGVEQ